MMCVLRNKDDNIDARTEEERRLSAAGGGGGNHGIAASDNLVCFGDERAINPFPQYAPMQRSAVVIEGMPAYVIGKRTSDFLRDHSIRGRVPDGSGVRESSPTAEIYATAYDNETCFVISLWTDDDDDDGDRDADGRPKGILLPRTERRMILETKRLGGSIPLFHELSRALFKAVVQSDVATLAEATMVTAASPSGSLGGGTIHNAEETKPFVSTTDVRADTTSFIASTNNDVINHHNHHDNYDYFMGGNGTGNGTGTGNGNGGEDALESSFALAMSMLRDDLMDTRHIGMQTLRYFAQPESVGHDQAIRASLAILCGASERGAAVREWILNVVIFLPTVAVAREEGVGFGNESGSNGIGGGGGDGGRRGDVIALSSGAWNLRVQTLRALADMLHIARTDVRASSEFRNDATTTRSWSRTVPSLLSDVENVMSCPQAALESERCMAAFASMSECMQRSMLGHDAILPSVATAYEYGKYHYVALEAPSLDLLSALTIAA